MAASMRECHKLSIKEYVIHSNLNWPYYGAQYGLKVRSIRNLTEQQQKTNETLIVCQTFKTTYNTPPHFCFPSQVFRRENHSLSN